MATRPAAGPTAPAPVQIKARLVMLEGELDQHLRGVVTDGSRCLPAAAVPPLPTCCLQQHTTHPLLSSLRLRIAEEKDSYVVQLLNVRR